MKQYNPVYIWFYVDTDANERDNDLTEIEIKRFKNELEAEEYSDALDLKKILGILKRKKISIPKEVKAVAAVVTTVFDYGDYEDDICQSYENLFVL